MTEYDVIVIGGGPAGLSAALSAKTNGAKNVLILERDIVLGGILNQCIHSGFGLHYFGEELTGPEYAERFIEKVLQSDILVKTDTMVLNVSPDHTIRAINQTEGLMEYHAKAVILAMGCRERPRGAISIPGDRPSGIFTAGTAQRYINIEGYMVGKKVVILGSGDIGLIMARRMTLEGAKVLACVEVMPYSSGLQRNIVQCLNDYNIPLYLSHTVTNIIGKKRLEKVEISKVDENRNPIPGTQFSLDCDTLLLSVGLIPENELTRNADIPIDPKTNGAIVYENNETLVRGIFSCGNVLQVHDLVDFVTKESERAGKSAADFSKGNIHQNNSIQLLNGNNVSYIVPQRLHRDCLEKSIELFFRVRKPKKKCVITVRCGSSLICKFARETVSPGEMEKIILPLKLIQTNFSELTVNVEDDNND